MGWFAASTATVIAAYALYALTARYAAQKADNRRSTPSPNGRVDVRGEDVATVPEKQPTVAPKENLSTGTPTVSLLPPTFEVSSPVIMQKTKPQLLVAPSKPPAVTSMPPPPPPSIRSSSPPRLKPPTMSAPPRPGNGIVRPPPSAAASLRVPQTRVLANTHMQPASSTLGIPKKSSRQVTLKPGYSPLDWAALTKDPRSRMRGKDAPEDLRRVTSSQLKKQNGRKGKDSWTVYQGKVYNITPYLPFHPGGEAEIMKGAGRDSAKLFMEVHPWVNWDGMLAECLVGILVAEDDAEAKRVNQLDEMD